MTIITIILRKDLMLSFYLQTQKLNEIYEKVYEIKIEKDVYEEFYKDKNLFDFSNYAKDSMFYDLTNVYIIDNMKMNLREK